MFVDTLPDGELLLPVCIEATEIHKMLSALEMYRVMVNGGKSYPAFEAVLNAIDYADNPEDSPCLDIEASGGACWTVDTTSAGIRFYPNDPFISIDKQERPPIGQWERWDDSKQRPPQWLQDLIALGEDVTGFNADFGYFPNDCLVVAPDETFNPAQFFASLAAIASLDFPYIEIECSGTGELELHLLKVAFGGAAIVVWDIEFNIADFLWDLVNGNSPDGNIIQTELEREILTFPPEANEENVIEIDFTEDTDHIVRVYFVPRIDYTALDFLGNGGGIREVSACGNLTLKTPDGDIINKSNHRLGNLVRKGFIMSTVDDIRQGVHLGIYDVMKHAIAGHGDGVNSNIKDAIQITAGGVASTVSSESKTAQEAIPGTVKELRYGGAYRQAVQFEKLIVDLDGFISSGYAVNTIVNITKVFVNPFDLTSWQSLITSYNSATTTIVIDVDLLAREIYCNGVSDGVLNYAVANHSASEIDLDYIVQFAGEIPQAKWDEWYAEGKKTPNSGYTSASCNRYDTQYFTYTADNFANNEHMLLYLSVPSSSNRYWRLVVEGVITDSDGDEFHGFYRKNVNGLIVYQKALLRPGNTKTLDPVSQPAYQPDGGYSVMYRNTFSDTLTKIDMAVSSFNTQFANPVGELKLTLIDMGF